MSSAPPPLASASVLSFSSCDFVSPGTSSTPSAPAASSAFGHSDDLPDDVPPDYLPGEHDPAVPPAVPENARSEFRRVLAFIVDHFPQAAGSPSVPPPPWALSEEFFGSAALPSFPVFLSWFKRVRTALSDADTRMAAFLASGRSDFSFLPPRNSSYVVYAEFVLGHTAPVNPTLPSLFEHLLKPSHYVGMTIREAAALEASLRSHLEALSHSMWVLSCLLAFVRLQNFAPEDSSLFNNLVTSLSKSLVYQVSLAASHTAFIALKRR